MLILRSIFLLSATLFTREIFGYSVPACTESSYGRLPYFESCTKFLECKNEQVTVHSCMPGLVFNSMIAECDSPMNVPGCENTQFQSPIMVVCPKDSIGLIAHPKDCAQYTQCFRGLPYPMICGPGYVYNIEMGYCDVRENVPGCQGDLGNGVNFRGDISISLPTSPAFPGRAEPHHEYYPRVPCSTPNCSLIDQQPPKVNVTFPSTSFLPLNEPSVLFRKTEMEKTTLNPITDNLFTSSDVNLITAPDRTTMNIVSNYPNIDETTIINNEEKSSTISTTYSSNIPQIINKTTTVGHTTTSKTETEDESRPDHTTTIISDRHSEKPIDVTSRSTYSDNESSTTEAARLSSEAETLITNVTPEVKESLNTLAPEKSRTTGSYKKGLRLIDLRRPEMSTNSRLKVNARFLGVPEKASGRSVDSSNSWSKNSWLSNSNKIENNNEINKKESNKNSSKDKLENSGKFKAVNEKESTVSTFPTKSNSRYPFYMMINDTKNHTLNNIHIDQDHSQIRSYNHAPLVVNKTAYKAPLQINQKSIDLNKPNNQLISWLETEPPFPLSYTPPIYSRSLENTPKLTPSSGQYLRLRGGSSLNHGYVEVQGSKPGWGIVCHTAPNWTLQEADIICHQLGYFHGAQMVWKGRYRDNEIYPWVATSFVECQGNETWFQACKFRDNSECNIEQDVVGIRCIQTNEVSCHDDEVFYGGYCYYLAKLNSSLDREEAAHDCHKRSSSLLFITSQKENDFVSEWLIRQHPDVESVILGGLGFPALNRSQWIWKDTHKTKFTFSKWWPGWDNEKILPPSVKSGVSCIVMKKEFPCSDNQNTKCHTDYFFWNTETCGVLKQNSTYICKRSTNEFS